MKSWSPALQWHYAQRVTTLADCWLIQPVQQEGAAPLGFTSHQRAIVVNGVTYQPVGFTPSDAVTTAELSVDVMELQAFFEAEGITQADIDAGVLDAAEVENFEVDYTAGEYEGATNSDAATTVYGDATIDAAPYIGWEVLWLTGDNAGVVSIIQSVDGANVTLTAPLPNNVTEGDAYRIRKGRNIKLAGTVGEIAYRSKNAVIFEFDSIARQLQQPVGEKLQPDCMNEFGGEWCGVDVVALREVLTVTAVANRVKFSDSGQSQPAGYFRGGLVRWTSGDNAGYSSEVRSYDGSQFEIIDPLPFPIAVADAGTVEPTCFKRFAEDCRDTWNNVARFRGFPHRLGRHKLNARPALV